MWVRLLRHRLRSIFRRDAVEDELERELSLHLEQLTREQIDAGLSEPEARRAAARAFGSTVLVKEQCRDARRVGLLEDLVKDTRYALRLLARSPGFAVTAILSMALGIGANTAIFSLIDAVLLRSLPVTRPQELVFIQAAGTAGPSGAPPYPCFERFRNETSSFAGMAAFATDDLRIVVRGTVEQAFGQVASGNYFEVLGVKPVAGRLLTMNDEKLDPPVAIAGYGYAQRRFGSAAQAIGRAVSFRDRAFTIVGVTPPEFWGLQPGRQVDLTIPITQEHAAVRDAGDWWFEAIARVRSGATITEATTQANTIFQSFMKGRDRSGELTRQYFDHIELRPAARGLERLRTRFSKPLHALTLVAAVVLLIACANIGSLLLVRGAARRHEFAIRLATGADAGRLLRQLLTETFVIVAIGAAAGFLVAHAATQALTGFFAIGRNPILLDVRYDWRLAAFGFGVALAAGLLTGLWPAARALRTQPHPTMKEGDGRLAGAGRLGGASRVLVAGQVALSLVLLVAAVLFVRTMVNLRAVDLGFRRAGVLTMSIDPIMSDAAAATHESPGREGAAAARALFWMRLLERVRAVPGVRAASLSVLTPLSGRDTGRGVVVPGYQPRSDVDRVVHVNHVSEDYFRTFGIRLLAGRAFTPRDDRGSVNVAVVNEATARAYFAGRSPIGEMLRFDESAVYRVVGIAGDARHMSVREPAPRFVFLPLWQPLNPVGRTTLAIESDQPPRALVRTIAREVRAIHSNTLISDVVGVAEQIDATLVTERLLSTLASAFAGLALGLAAIGLYGVLSYAVATRRAEFGLRIALGASRARIAGSVIRGVMIQVVVGIVAGVPLAAAAARATGGLLYGVTPSAAGVYVVSAVALVAIACAAAWAPTWRACSIDPSQALRSE